MLHAGNANCVKSFEKANIPVKVTDTQQKRCPEQALITD